MEKNDDEVSFERTEGIAFARDVFSKNGERLKAAKHIDSLIDPYRVPRVW